MLKVSPRDVMKSTKVSLVGVVVGGRGYTREVWKLGDRGMLGGGGGSPKLPKKQLDVKYQRHYGRTQRQKQEAPDRKRIISESIA